MKAVPAEGRASVATLSQVHADEIGKMLYDWSSNENWPAPGGGTATDYGFYALHVYSLLRDGQDANRVAALLGRFRLEYIGVPPHPESDRETAQRLIAWWNGL